MLIRKVNLAFRGKKDLQVKMENCERKKASYPSNLFYLLWRGKRGKKEKKGKRKEKIFLV